MPSFTTANITKIIQRRKCVPGKFPIDHATVTVLMMSVQQREMWSWPWTQKTFTSIKLDCEQTKYKRKSNCMPFQYHRQNCHVYEWIKLFSFQLSSTDTEIIAWKVSKTFYQFCKPFSLMTQIAIPCWEGPENHARSLLDHSYRLLPNYKIYSA
jgi:hypothetical protein